MTSLYVALGFGICIAFCILLGIRFGKMNERNKIMEANVEALKKNKDTVEAIVNHKSGDGITNLKRLSQRKRK